MAKSKWSPLDQKAIAWWAKENGAVLRLPFAWPQVTFAVGEELVTKEIYHLRSAYEKHRQSTRRTDTV
jgi:hypothetical protein